MMRRCPYCATRARVVDGQLLPHNRVRVYYGADAQPEVPCPNRELAVWDQPKMPKVTHA